MTSATPQPYPVVYNAQEGAVQYAYQSGYIDIPEAPLNAITSLTGAVTASGPGAAVATVTAPLALNSGASTDSVINLTANGVTSTIYEEHNGLTRLILQNNGGAALLINAAAGTVSCNCEFANPYPIRSTADICAGSLTNDPSAVLLATSVTQGFLPPRMTTTQKDAIATPTEGLMVYDLTLHKLCIWTGAAWETITSA